MSDPSASSIELAFVGDLILGTPDAEKCLAPSAEYLAAADIAVGHVEWPHTDRGAVSSADLPAPAAPPSHLEALARAGIDVATLAANHIFDQGPFGVQDTVERLKGLGIATTGAGLTLAEARRPAVLEKKGLRFGFLSYNAVGPRESWATPTKAGAAPIRVHSHYELEMASPGSPPTEFTMVDVDSLRAMTDDIERLASTVDIVTVSLHKGLVFERARLAQYESMLSRAAIDAGAHIIVGHHAHMPRGMEVYKGRPIFHGINHFVTAYAPHGDPATRTRPERSPILDLVEPDPAMKVPFPFSREARHTMIARVVVDRDGVVSAGFTPCWIDEDARTHVLPDADRGRDGVEHIRAISREANLDTEYRWAGDRVLFLERKFDV